MLHVLKIIEIQNYDHHSTVRGTLRTRLKLALLPHMLAALRITIFDARKTLPSRAAPMTGVLPDPLHLSPRALKFFQGTGAPFRGAQSRKRVCLRNAAMIGGSRNPMGGNPVTRVIACALSALLVCAPSLARAAGPDQPSRKQETLKKAAPQPTAKNKSRPSSGSGGDRHSESISLNRKPAPAQNRQGYNLKKNAP